MKKQMAVDEIGVNNKITFMGYLIARNRNKPLIGVTQRSNQEIPNENGDMLKTYVR